MAWWAWIFVALFVGFLWGLAAADEDHWHDR